MIWPFGRLWHWLRMMLHAKPTIHACVVPPVDIERDYPEARQHILDTIRHDYPSLYAEMQLRKIDRQERDRERDR